MKLAHLLSLASALALLACSASPETVTSGSVRQLEVTTSTVATPSVLVIVVDDAPTPEAAALRAGIVAELRDSTEQLVSSVLPFPQWPWDPAARHTTNLHVVVVHPSVVGSGRAFGPSDDPRLALVTDDASIAQTDALADAIGAAVATPVAPAGAPYLALEALAATIHLLAGDRTATDAHEAALVTALGTRTRFLQVLFATTHDDQSPGAPASYGVRGDVGSGLPWEVYAKLVTSLASDSLDRCNGLSPDPATRLGAWSTNVDRVLTWPCAPADLAAQGLFAVEGRGFYATAECLPSPVAARSSGEAACALTWKSPSLDPCDASRGLLDPRDARGDRKARIDTLDGMSVRVCEIRELTGDAYAACSTTLACTGCTPGWCDRPNGPFSAGTCGNRIFDFRFVGGALPAADAQLTITCDLAP